MSLPPPPDAWMTVAQAAVALGVSVGTIYRRSAGMPAEAVRANGRRLEVNPAAWLAERRRQAAAAGRCQEEEKLARQAGRLEVREASALARAKRAEECARAAERRAEGARQRVAAMRGELVGLGRALKRARERAGVPGLRLVVERCTRVAGFATLELHGITLRSLRWHWTDAGLVLWMPPLSVESRAYALAPEIEAAVRALIAEQAPAPPRVQPKAPRTQRTEATAAT